MKTRRALIVKFGQIGDVIMAIPAARALFDQGFEIHWACGAAAYPLLQTYSWIHLIRVHDKAILRGSLPARLAAIFSFWRIACRGRYDLCATLYYDRRFRLLSLPIRATRKVMLSRESRSAMLIPGRHHTDEFHRILLQQADSYQPQSIPPVAPDILVPSPLPPKAASQRIVLVPGGTSNLLGEQVLRRWPVEHYVALAERLISRGSEVILLGGKEDKWVKPHFHTLPVTDCIATLSLPQVVSLFNDCDAAVIHDTGPLHLAGLSNVSLVGLFGPTDPATRLPRRPFAVGLWGGEALPCRPCYDGTNFAPCQFNGCLQQLSPELVLKELDKLVSARDQGIHLPWHVAQPGVSKAHSSVVNIL